VRQYKLILITEFANPWNSGWYYKAGFEQNSHIVIPFDPAGDAYPVRAISKIIEEEKPDFIMHTKDELPAESFRELAKTVKVIMWYPDPVIPEWLLPYVKASDVFLTMSEGLIPEFKQYNPNVFWLTQAFGPSFFETGSITKQDIDFYSSDVAFVGNLGSKNQYLSRRSYLDRVIRSGVNLKWWGPKIPRKISTLPLVLGKLGKAYGGKFVWGAEYAKVAQLSRVFLAFDSMPHIRKSMSARMYTAVGSGAFYMCQHVDGIEEVLEPGKEIVTFRSENDMIDLIKYYLQKDELRREIADAGRNRVLKEHSYKVRMNQMIELIKEFI
jgi:spore maturation protein CgeB